MKLPKFRLKLKTKSSKIFLLFSLLFTLCSLLSPVLAAEERNAFTISPPLQEIEASPGQTVTATIKVISDQDAPLALQLSIYDFVVFDDQGTPVLMTNELKTLTAQEYQKYALSSWVFPEVKQFSLKGRETRDIQVAVVVPKNAAAGGRYAALTIQNLQGSMIGANKEKASGGTGAVTQVLSLLSLKIKGAIKEDILLKSFTTPKQIFEFGPVDFTTQIKNLSDIHIQPKGNIIIRNMFGKVSAELPFSQLNIFPSATKSYANRWETTWGFGKYSAQLNLHWGSGQVLNSLIYFWIIPAKIVIAVLVLIAVLLIVGLSIRSHVRHLGLVEEKALSKKDVEIRQLKKEIENLKEKK